MNKQVYLFLSFLLLTSMSFAQETVSQDDAIQMAKKFIANKIYSKSNNSAVTNVVVNGSDTILYEVIVENKSIIIPGIKSCKPVLAYLDNPQGVSALDSASLEANGHGYFIRKYIDQIVDCLDSGNDYKIHPGWNLEEVNTDTKSASDTIIDPLISSRWGQSASNDNMQSNAYNYFISSTLGFRSDTCPTGCVATAMGQIMNYWKYPIYKKGGVYQYDWCNMVDELRIERPNYVMERNAVARLLADCGDAVGMDYCMPLNFYYGSFAWPQYARDAFVEDFGYNDNATIIRRQEGNYSDSDWKDRIVGSLMSGCPVFYAAIEKGTLFQGHAFVCDGYRSTDRLFHFIFGWKDDNDQWKSNWFSLENIYPDSNQLFNKRERAIIWLYPGENDVFCDYTLDLTRYYSDNIYNGIVQETPSYFVPNTYANLISSREQPNVPASWRTIPSGESSEYIAHKSVTLLPGFHAERGSTFSARIAPCSTCDSEEMLSMTQSTMALESDNYQDSTISTKSVVVNNNAKGVNVHRLFPNPSHETITYQGKEVTSMAIYDLSGKAVYRWFIVSKTANEIVVNIKDLRPSAYVLLLNMSDGTREAMGFVKE